MNPIVACKLSLNCNAPQVSILTKVWAKMVRNFGAYPPTLTAFQITNKSARHATPCQAIKANIPVTKSISIQMLSPDKTTSKTNAD